MVDSAMDVAYLRTQSVEVGDPIKGQSRVRRNARHPVIETYYDPEIRTVHDIYENVGTKFKELPFLGKRKMIDGKAGPYEFISYGEAYARWYNIGSALKHLGLAKGDRVGIFAINRPEWILTDAACHNHSLVPVALYATLGANAIEFVVNHADITTILCDGKNLDKVLALEACKGLKTIITFDGPSEEHKEKAKTTNFQLFSLAEFEETGKANPHPNDPPTFDSLYTIMYTSGTTGNPKGVMLPHKAAVAEVTGARAVVSLSPADVHMSYLPLAHSFERVIALIMTALGCHIGFFQGLIPELFNDITELKPTFLCGAPRVFQRLHDKIKSTMDKESVIKRTLFNWGLGSKMNAIKEGGTTPIWDTILFSKTKERLGGRVKFILSGSAPLDPTLADFLKACFCCPVVQGYGLTENFAGATISYGADSTVGHVGTPLTCTEIKLVDVPEMNYTSQDKPCPRGEVCLRGPNVFIGYFKDPEKTAEDLKEDGWFHTGDVGRWNPNGTLSIIDRKKNIFKLSQGEYVAAEYLEAVFLRSPYVGQIFVYGDSFNSFLVAIAVPDYDVVTPLAQQLGIPNAEDQKEVAANKQIEAAILKSMVEVGKAANLHGFEFIKAIHVEHVPFSEENDLLTPSFKLRRPNLKQHYQKVIETLYEEYKKAHPDA